VVDHSSFSSVDSLFHACGAATEKAQLQIRRHVRGTRLPDNEACSADHTAKNLIVVEERKKLVGALTLVTELQENIVYIKICATNPQGSLPGQVKVEDPNGN